MVYWIAMYNYICFDMIYSMCMDVYVKLVGKKLIIIKKRLCLYGVSCALN